LKNSSNRSSNGVPWGSCGRVRLRASTVVVAEMLTTAPVTSSARSAKDSGAERAWTAAGIAVTASAKAAAKVVAIRRGAMARLGAVTDGSMVVLMRERDSS
jgi:hypothetical protein